MSQNPIEINQKDLVERPATWKPGSPPAKPGGGILGGLKQAKEALNQFKELRDMLKEMGINIPVQGEAKNEPAPGASQLAMKGATGIAQFQMFIQLLIANYGDVTVSELLEKLRAEHGGKT